MGLFFTFRHRDGRALELLGCPDCITSLLDDLRRLLLVTQFAIASGEPSNYGFSWSP